MKITNIKTHLLTTEWADDPSMPNMLHSAAVVRVETDTELDGLGEVTWGYFAPEAVPPVVNYFEPVLIGKNPLDVECLTRAMLDDAVWWARTGAGRSVIGGIELALWDLKGKALKVPVYQLLGGKVRDEIPVYASGGASCWPIDETVRKVEFYAECGYQTTKLSTDFYSINRSERVQSQGRLEAVQHPFSKQIENLVLCFDRLRKAFGGEMDFAVDGHQGGVPNPIPVSEAVEIAEALAVYRLRFYEEPLAYTNVDGYKELRGRSRIPIAGGESLCGLHEFHALIAGQGLHIVQPDIGFVGGLQETVRITHHAEGFGMSTAIHTGGSMGPSLAASWHLAAASGSVQWLEHAVASRTIQNDLLLDSFEVKNGRVKLPSSPGLGVHLNPALIEKYRFVLNSGERT